MRKSFGKGWNLSSQLREHERDNGDKDEAETFSSFEAVRGLLVEAGVGEEADRKVEIDLEHLVRAILRMVSLM